MCLQFSYGFPKVFQWVFSSPAAPPLNKALDGGTPGFVDDLRPAQHCVMPRTDEEHLRLPEFNQVELISMMINGDYWWLMNVNNG